MTTQETETGEEFWEGEPVEHWQRLWQVPVLLVLARTGSTNDVARRLAERGAPTGTVVLAEIQTEGRGRGGRRWEAPSRAALLLSLLIRLEGMSRAETGTGGIPLRVGLGLALAIERTVGVETFIKWPNDVLLAGDRKVAGILCEGVLTAQDRGFVVVGIGVNVNQRVHEFDPELRQSATSLRLEAGRPVPRPPLAGAIVEEVLALLQTGVGPIAAPVLQGIERRNALKGREITVDGVPRGIAREIAPDGGLVIEDVHGRSATLYNGTVRPVGLRPGPGKNHP